MLGCDVPSQFSRAYKETHKHRLLFAGRGHRLRFGKQLPASDHPPDGQSVLNVSQRVLVQQYDIRQFARSSAEKNN
jgi:hypothetical protein